MLSILFIPCNERKREVQKKILVTRSSMPPKEEYYKEIEELWGSHWLTNMGVKHNKLEDELKQYLEVENI